MVVACGLADRGAHARSSAIAAPLARYPALDGLRGLAVLAVVAHHALPLGTFALPAPLGRLAEVGWLGVDVFFTLSGFLITRILLATRDLPDYYLPFYRRRAARILPLYFLVVGGLLAIAPSMAGDLRVYPGWTYLLFLSNLAIAWGGALGWMPLAITWSVAIEEQFYLAWAPIVRRWSPAAVERMILGVLVLGGPLRLAVTLLDPVSKFTAYTLTICRLDGLLIGALVALVQARGGGPALALREQRRSKSLEGLDPEPGWPPTAPFQVEGGRPGVFAGPSHSTGRNGAKRPLSRERGSPSARNGSPPRALAVAFGLVGALFVAALTDAIQPDAAWFLALGYPLAPAATGLFIASLAGTGGIAQRALSWAPLRALGRVSYAVYLLHVSVLAVLWPLLPAGAHSAWDGVGWLALTLGITWVLAEISMRVFEAPMLRRFG